MANTFIKSLPCIAGGSLLAIFACGTDAIGVAECREIEQARCLAAEACGYGDAQGCQRFFRDHCLHGLALPEVDASDVEDCVNDVEAAARCAREQGGDTAPAACGVPIVAPSAESVCGVVRQPELAPSCAFLRPNDPPAEPPPEPDAGGGAG